MSNDTGGLAAPGTSAHVPKEPESKTTYKSWKKKFRKMKHEFDQRMRESDQLYREEHKARETMQRLQEQNDQLLDLLLDVNQSIHIPFEHRYDLGSPSSKTPDAMQVPGLDTDNSPGSSHDSLQSIKHFQSLLKTPHTSLAILEADSVPEDLQPSSPPTYYTTNHESGYLESLDKSLGLSPTVLRSLPCSSGERLAEVERESDFNIRNPVSVYNWLRKHQPQVFLQDHEASADKMTKTGDKRGAGKRASIAAAKATPEFVDDDNYTLGADIISSAGKSGRKRRDEDAGYRPKGGANKPGKRKREDDPMGSKKIRKKGP